LQVVPALLDATRRHLYQKRPERYEYRLTRKGVGRWPVIMSLLLWGDQHYAANGGPVVLIHRGCTGQLTSALTCSECGASLGPTNIDPRPSPGALPTDRVAQQAAASGAS
jgi:hypothetical protein